MKTFAISTLGCKVNQYESAVMVESLRKSGYEEVSFGEKADLYVVNTCTVTSKASYQSRQLLRRAHRINPEATIVAAGCYCEIEAQKIASLGIATHILGNVEKLHLTDYIGKSASLTKPLIVVSGIKNSRHSELIELITSRVERELF